MKNNLIQPKEKQVIQKNTIMSNNIEMELDREIEEENDRSISSDLDEQKKPNNNNADQSTISNNDNKNKNKDYLEQKVKFNEENNIEVPLIIKAKLLDKEDQNAIKKAQDTRLNPLANLPDAKTESNGIFQVEPKAVIFKGFEITSSELNNKSLTKYEKIVKVINRTQFPQRLSIIPPTTIFFKIKFTRSGLISQGLAETILVQFFPQKYQYYYDFIQVNCDMNEKLIIPIHAYPVMNIHKYPKYVPRFINFDSVLLNHTATKSITFKNIIEAASFEFEFVPVKTCPEIQILPFFGEIEPSSDRQITVSFNPSKYGTYISEYEFRLSEYNFEPIRVTISGTCKVYDKSKLGNEEENSETAMVPQAKKYPVYKLKKASKLLNPENELKLKEQTDEALKMTIQPKDYLNNLLQEKEKSFMEYFSLCENLIRDKEIKYKKFIGCELLKPHEIQEIKRDKFNEIKQFNLFYRKIYSQIYQVMKDSKQTNALINQKYLLKPLFSKNNNNNFFKNRKYFKIFLSALTKIVIHKRANLRLDKLMPLVKSGVVGNTTTHSNLSNNNALIGKSQQNQSQSDALGNQIKKEDLIILDKVDELLKVNNAESKVDYKNSVEMNSLKPKKAEERLISKTDFIFDFNIPIAINKPPLFISDVVIDYSKEKIPYENNIFFDEQRQFDMVDRMDQELLNYREFKSNGMSQYEISLEDKQQRPQIIVFESFSNG